MNAIKIIFLIIGYSPMITAQINKVYIDDSMYVKHYIIPGRYKFNSEGQIIDSNAVGFSLKDSLPDGQWLLYNCPRPDSGFPDEIFLRERAFYMNGMKDKTFYTYQRQTAGSDNIVVSMEEYQNGKKNGVSHQLCGKIVCNYINDTLDGLYIIQSKRASKIRLRKKSLAKWELNANVGKKARFKNIRFLLFGWPMEENHIEQIIVYEMGKIKQWTLFSCIDGRVLEFGQGDIINEVGIITMFYKNGVPKEKYYISKTILMRAEYFYDNGAIKEEIEYETMQDQRQLQDCYDYSINDGYNLVIWNNKPCFGYIRKYNVDGELTASYKYWEGKIIE